MEFQVSVNFYSLSLKTCIESFENGKGSPRWICVGEEGIEEISYDPVTGGFDVRGRNVGIGSDGLPRAYWVPREMVDSAHRDPPNLRKIPSDVSEVSSFDAETKPGLKLVKNGKIKEKPKKSPKAVGKKVSA